MSATPSSSAVLDVDAPFMPDSRERCDRLLAQYRPGAEFEYRRALAAGKDRPVVFVADLTDGTAREVFGMACGPDALAGYDSRPLLPAGSTMAAVQWSTATDRAIGILNAAGLGWIAAGLDTPMSWPDPAFNVVFLVPDGVAHVVPCPVPADAGDAEVVG